MKNCFYILLFIVCTQLSAKAQGVGITFQKAKEQGISYDSLEKVYISAVNVDTAAAVFKTEDEQKAMYFAYVELLTCFGEFLSENKFHWENDVKCFNRIYFSPEGKIEYFLFNFFEESDKKPSEEVQAEFQRLLNLFIQDYQFSLKADVRFAQCSPVLYQAKEE